MLLNMKELLKVAKENRFAVGAFNVADSNFLRAVVEEAEESNSPAIIAIHPDEFEFLTDEFFAYVRERAGNSSTPFVLHLDHGASLDQVVRAIRAGFTSVMIDGSLLPYDENVEKTRKVVEIAHMVNVSVEGELGTIGDTGTTVEGGVSEITYVDPEDVEDFIAKTNVDTLAVAVGTAHGIYPKDVKPKLQLELIEDIVNRVDTPLVLHGGSSNPDKEVARAVKIGIQKVNISSDMKFAFYKKAREILSTTELWDPNAIFPECIDAARDVIRYKMDLFESTNKAGLYSGSESKSLLETR
ncbi:ketose-bisphosphate aldolase [Marinilactibacillus psychrotolerans]|uniref:Ketose-bisphosphate aldolase n=2 Tax=Marinilactibacillus psychrotolerans TaxID=191770 RepID=A0A5R9C4J3_9LACT|nr:ketose-bisphosphate aldolase [Marinilactibacillus psychrotolerans]TLQ07792.1 ketose-bisphosphate aldolase [Marinilactibacillus psychrotolerans]SJN23479.1 Fructose-bisphosphate aldolase class II [Marinilactibacillus psychrotolerans 42ea]